MTDDIWSYVPRISEVRGTLIFRVLIKSYSKSSFFSPLKVYFKLITKYLIFISIMIIIL